MKNSRTKETVKGISLVEILIVITIFALLGLIVSSSLILTIHGTKKSDAAIKVRENINYSLSVIERNLRNAKSVTVCAEEGDTNPDNYKSITYIDQYGVSSTFSCVNTGSDNSYIASGSAKLSSGDVNVTNCSFSCAQPEDLSKPPFVSVEISATNTGGSGVLNASVSAETRIYLRN